MATMDNFLFISFPYLAFAVCIVGSIYRYKVTPFKYSSLSSQFLEDKKLFWSSIPFHWGIVALLVGHLMAFLIPQGVILWNSSPARLIALEITGFAFGLSVLVGLVRLYIRRIGNPRVSIVSNKMDMVLEVILILQVVLGLWIALGYRWGSSWFAATLSPYLWSLVKLNPDISAVSALPHVIKFHIVLAYLILFLIPFTRLVHFLVAPFHYIGRPYQQVIWYWDRKSIRSPETSWSKFRPKNN